VDSRHVKRISIIQNIFAYSFKEGDAKIVLPHKEYAEVTSKIFEHVEKIDEIISAHAPKYPLDKIAKTDLCVLRLAVYELMIEKTEPLKVIINEAVELAKELGNDRSFAFINAVLGSIVSELPKDSEQQS